MSEIQLAVAIAQNVVTTFAGRETLQKHEMLLYSQACRTLQGYLRMTETLCLPEQQEEFVGNSNGD